MKKYNNILLVLLQNLFPLDVMVMHKFSVIGASFGDSIQRGRGSGEIGYIDK